MSDWHSAKDIAALSVGPNSVYGVAKAAKREKWTSRKRKGRGGGLEYNIKSMPIEIRRALAANKVKSDSVGVPSSNFHVTSTDGRRPSSPLSKGDGLLILSDDPSLQRRATTGAWRLDVIRPALAFEAGSTERSAAVDTIAEHQHLFDNKPKKVSRPTIYRWLDLYEKGGMQGLMPKARADAAVDRTLISRKWDAACPLSEDDQNKIADTLSRYMRSLWASGSPTWRKVSRLGTARLQQLCVERGWHASEKVCTVGRRLVEREKRYRLVAIAEQDASKLYNDFLPPILRTRNGLRPGDLVVGDVHPIDIIVKRPDGSEACPRAVAWLDVATMQLHISLILCAPNEGVRREHVGLSFAGIVEKVGVPLVLYEDNGSEYDWRDMLDAWADLARMTGRMQTKVMDADVKRRLGGVVKAMPYNARAKNIEGIFSVLERTCFSQIPGWIGGNRMNKKTANQGKAPVPFNGTWEEFHRAVDVMLEEYHSTPQKGLGDMSPNDKVAEFRAQGWKPVAPKREALLLSFAETFEPVVRSGRIHAGGNIYYADELVSFSDGGRIKVRVPRHDPMHAFCFSGRNLIAIAHLEQPFGWLEQAGAKEAGRRRVALRRTISEMKHHCDRLDLVEETAKSLGYDEKDKASDNVTMLPGVDTTQMLKAVQAQLKEASEQRAESSPALSQWGDDDDDPYLRAVS